MPIFGEWPISLLEGGREGRPGMSGLSVTATLTKPGSLLSLLGAGRKILITYCLVNASP